MALSQAPLRFWRRRRCWGRRWGRCHRLCRRRRRLCRFDCPSSGIHDIANDQNDRCDSNTDPGTSIHIHIALLVRRMQIHRIGLVDDHRMRLASREEKDDTTFIELIESIAPSCPEAKQDAGKWHCHARIVKLTDLGRIDGDVGSWTRFVIRSIAAIAFPPRGSAMRFGSISGSLSPANGWGNARRPRR